MDYNIKELELRWDELRSYGSNKRGREIKWPRPSVLRKKNILDVAHRQLECGYVGNQSDSPVKIYPGIDWKIDPFQSRPWRTRLMCLQPIDIYCYAYEETGCESWLYKALDLLLDWTNYHVLQGKKSFRAWADMPVGYRSLKYAYIVDLALTGRWQPELADITAILIAVDRYLSELTKLENLSNGNHGVFQLHGLKVLLEICWNSPLYVRSNDFVKANLERIIRNQFSEEGVHLEHSPQYHWWMKDELNNISNSRWHDSTITDYIESVSQKAESAKHWMISPTGSFIRLGDTTRSQPARPPSPYASDNADYITGTYRAKVFYEGGYAICKGTDSTLFFHCAYHSKSHKHQDDLHFDLHDLGTEILVDAGSTGYKVGKERQYVISTAAHNTISVDNENYPRDGTDRYGSAIKCVEAEENRIRFHGEVNHWSLGVLHRRLLDYVPGSALRCYDELHCRKIRKLTQWFHFAPKWELQDVGKSYVMLVKDDAWVSLVCRERVNVEVYHGVTEPGLKGWRSVSKTLVAAWSIAFITEGKKVEFDTLVSYGIRERTTPIHTRSFSSHGFRRSTQ